jgi:iron complex transport system substrate-binding protein
MSFALSKWRARRPSFVAVFALLALLIAACGDSDDATPSPTATTAVTEVATAAPTDTPEPTPTESAPPLVVADSDGFELEFTETPTRIVSFSPGATEILFAIGAGDQVIAADQFSDFPAETVDLEQVSYSEPDPERSLGLDPDLIIMATRQQESVEQFRNLGLTVLFNREPESVEGVLENITILGEVSGHEAEAADLVADMRARIDAVGAAIAGVDTGPRVFYELSDGLYTAAPDTFIGGYLTLLKASNVAEGAESAFPQLTVEALIDANPEVILLADAEFGGDPATVAARPGWDAIDAVINERLYPVDPDVGNRPGPRIVDAIEQVAALLYPELFG